MKKIKLQLPGHLVEEIYDRDQGVASLIPRLVETGLDRYQSSSGVERERRTSFIDAFVQEFRQVRKSKAGRPVTLEEFLERRKRNQSSAVVKFSVSIDDYLWRETNGFIDDYNSRSRDIETKIEAYSALVLQAIDPDEPWPNN